MNRVQKTSRLGLVVALLALVFSTGCEIEETVTVYTDVYRPVYLDLNRLRTSVEVVEPVEYSDTGKIYVFGTTILVNEVDRGIHIVDNADPQNPVRRGFVNIPGNRDIAVRGNFLYADSYIDLVVLNINDINHISEAGRLQNVVDYTRPSVSFEESGLEVNPEHQIQYEEVDPEKGIVIAWEFVRTDKEVFVVSHGGLFGGEPVAMADYANAEPIAEAVDLAGPASGQAGSLARFALVGEYLYTIDNEDMTLYNLDNPARPVLLNRVSVGFGIETIFPYEDMLFIGAFDGMYIFDNSRPDIPQMMSKFWHSSGCDPVVADGSRAYITLRGGNSCDGFENQLDIVDITDPRRPMHIETWPMYNPRGLAIDNNLLFICDGPAGLKVYDSSDPEDLVLLDHIGGIETWDVILQNNRAIVTASEGLYQFDYSNPSELVKLSAVEGINRLQL